VPDERLDIGFLTGEGVVRGNKDLVEQLKHHFFDLCIDVLSFPPKNEQERVRGGAHTSKLVKWLPWLRKRGK